MTEIRELSIDELNLVSGSGGKTQAVIGGFKFTLWANGDFGISAGGYGVKSDSKGQVLEVRTPM